MKKEESRCLMSNELEISKQSFRIKLEKPDKTIKIMWLYKEKLN